MPKSSRHLELKRHRNRGWLLPPNLVGLLPLSALTFAVAASAQTNSPDKENTAASGTGSSTTTTTSTTTGTATPAATSNAPSFSRGPSAGTTPTPLVSEVTIEEPTPGLPANTPPSFYGSSGSSATSSLGLPGFAATAPSLQSSTASSYPLQWGPFSFHPHLGYAYTYADGVLITPGMPTITASHRVSPGLSIVSRHLSLDYTPSLVYYSKGPYNDSLDHSVDLGATWGYGDWTFQLHQGYQRSTPPLVETGTQTETQSLPTSIAANWNFSEKWFFDFTLSQSFQDSQGFQSSKQWSTMEWANYRLTPQLSVGAGIGGGFTDVNMGSDSTYEQIQGRINWRPSRRFSLGLNGGVEIRQFLDVPRSDSLVNPIMGASMTYQIFDYTSLYLSANRSVDASLFANQITENSGVTAGVSQRLLKYINLGLSGGFRRTDYKGTFTIFGLAFPTLRRDDYSYVSTSLGTTFFRKGIATVAYTHGQNESTLAGYTYGSDQISVQIAYRF